MENRKIRRTMICFVAVVIILYIVLFNIFIKDNQERKPLFVYDSSVDTLKVDCDEEKKHYNVYIESENKNLKIYYKNIKYVASDDEKIIIYEYENEIGNEMIVYINYESYENKWVNF